MKISFVSPEAGAVLTRVRRLLVYLKEQTRGHVACLNILRSDGAGHGVGAWWPRYMRDCGITVDDMVDDVRRRIDGEDLSCLYWRSCVDGVWEDRPLTEEGTEETMYRMMLANKRAQHEADNAP